MTGDGKVQIYTYTDYRIFLKDKFDQLSKENPEFSRRKFSKAVGLKSCNFFTYILRGERNISDSLARSIAKQLVLSEEETSFFLNLVHYNQAKKASDRQHYTEMLVKESYRKFSPLAEAKFEYYSKWYTVAINEMLESKDFQNDPEWIGSHLRPAIAPAKVAEAVDTLSKLGFIKLRKDGRLEKTFKTLITEPELNSLLVRAFHRQMITKALESLDNIELELREVSSATVNLDEGAFREVKKILQESGKKILALAEKVKNPDIVYQVNFQLFPLTKKTSRSGKD